MTILAIDPGLAHVGACLFADDGSIIDADVFTSTPEKRPSKFVGAWYAQDLGRRGTKLASWLRDLVDQLDGPHDTVVIEGVVLSGSNVGGIAPKCYAAGVVDAIVSEAVPSPSYVTVAWWRSSLGFEPADRPPIPNVRGLSKAKQTAALKPWRTECARIKREDDRRLYAMLTEISAGVVAELVKAHGRRGSDAVHALDAFGIGVARLKSCEARRAR